MQKNRMFLFLILIALGFFSFHIFISDRVNREEVKDSKFEYNREIGVDSSEKEVKYLEDNFSLSSVLEEEGSMPDSKSRNWWLNSGAMLTISNGTGKTIHGELKNEDSWRQEYEDYNSSETDKGYHPQNIFRLITKSKWSRFNQEAYFKINRYILSKDKHRSASNGILLFCRYKDSDNLYYAGLRVDGAVVVKKKYQGTYSQLGYKKVFEGSYNRFNQPNLLPINTWLGVRVEIDDISKEEISLKVSIKKEKGSDWEQVLNVIDRDSVENKLIKGEGFAGIRTDFMDVEFDNYRIEERRYGSQ